MNRSTAAFLIALLFHLLIILLWLIFILHIPQNKSVPKEDRIKISLKEYHPPKSVQKPTFGREKKIIKRPVEAPPMPKGSQLKKIVQPQSHEKTEKTIRKIVHEPRPKMQVVKQKPPKIQRVQKNSIIQKVQVHPQEKSTIKLTTRQIKPTPTVQEDNASDHSKLIAFLSTPDKTKSNDSKKNTNDERASQIQQNIKELYGETFGKLSPGEQKYILDNAEIMRRITQQVLNRVGSVNIPNNLHVTTSNVVQFYLHPNGDMTDFKFLHKSNFYILDETTKETIEYAYSRYPRPKQTTLIRYKVNYLLGGY